MISSVAATIRSADSSNQRFLTAVSRTAKSLEAALARCPMARQLSAKLFSIVALIRFRQPVVKFCRGDLPQPRQTSQFPESQSFVAAAPGVNVEKPPTQRSLFP